MESGTCEDCKRKKTLFVVNNKKKCYACILVELERLQHKCEWFEDDTQETKRETK